MNTSQVYWGKRMDVDPNSFNWKYNSQKHMDFSLEVVLVQWFALFNVVASDGGFWTWCFFGSHLWTTCLCLTWDVIKEDGGQSCFGFEVFLGTLCYCCGWAWSAGFPLDSLLWLWLVGFGQLCSCLAINGVLAFRRDLGTQAQYKPTWWTSCLGIHLCLTLMGFDLQVLRCC